MLHAPGQFVPDELLALPVPQTNALPLQLASPEVVEIKILSSKAV